MNKAKQSDRKTINLFRCMLNSTVILTSFACNILDALPLLLHLRDPFIMGPNKFDSTRFGDELPRQLSFADPIHGLIFGVLKKEY